MMGDGYKDFQDIFAANPPPGGFYDPFAVTGEGTYVAPEVRFRLKVNFSIVITFPDSFVERVLCLALFLLFKRGF